MHSLAQSKADLEKQNHDKLKRGIDAKEFHFLATSATTSKGGTLQLTGGYFLFVGRDSLTVGLPFFGREHQASHYGASKEDAGINFHTHEFTIKTDSTKKGGWEITIVPSGQTSASRIFLSVSSSGSCRTTVNSSTRSPMTFYGNVLSNFKE
jgi:hypothetical protein